MNKIPSASNLYEPCSHCRVCKDSNLEKVLTLKSTPPANAFIRGEDLDKPEPLFPLELYFCNSCSFIQLGNVVSSELLFRNYVYTSSISPTFIKHFESLANTVTSRLGLEAGSLVVDIGSNDGILLRPFKQLGWQVLGIDPAIKIAKEATKNGIETLPLFFNSETAREIKLKYGPAELITATSVFPHIDNLDDVVAGVRELLTPNGVFLIEAYYLADLLEKKLFDTVYHEHLSYFSVKTASRLLERLNMKIFDVEKTDTHGGSLRIWAEKTEGTRPINYEALKTFLSEEASCGLNQIKTYTTFAREIDKNKERLLQLLKSLKAQGKRIAGYGAAAKGNTLLNHFEIGGEFLDYIVDDSPWKQGLYTPATRLPVVSRATLAEQKPDYILILAWNFAEPIMEKLGTGHKFIIPVPKPMIIEDLVDHDIFTISQSLGALTHKLQGKTLLITGGSGFIGSYIVATINFLNRYIFNKSCRVISIDNHLVGKRQNLIRERLGEEITFIKHDVCLPLQVDEPIDYVVNAAGVASPVYYKKFPIETIEGTIFGLKNTLELARQKGAASVLFFSSSEIYGDPDPNFIPTPETYKGNVSSTGPRACYDESKRIGETLALAYHSVHGLPVKIVRPFNVYGPGMNSKDYRVIPTFLSQGLSEQPLTVHDRGNQTRSFCYVTDAIIGFLRVLLAGKDGEIYNIGNSRDEINMLSLARLITTEIFENERKMNLVNYPDTYPQDEPRRRCPDLTKARTTLAYEPQIDLKNGLKRTLTWFRENNI